MARLDWIRPGTPEPNAPGLPYPPDQPPNGLNGIGRRIWDRDQEQDQAERELQKVKEKMKDERKGESEDEV